MKKLLRVLCALVLVFALCACTTTAKEEGTTAIPYTSVATLPTNFANYAEGKVVYFIQPGLGEMSAMASLLNGFEISYEYFIDTEDHLYTASEVDTTVETLIIVSPGNSGKGLGDAGTNDAQEVARAKAFAELAKNNEKVHLIQVTSSSTDFGEKSDSIHAETLPQVELVITRTSALKDTTVLQQAQVDYGFTLVEATNKTFKTALLSLLGATEKADE